LGEVIDRTVEIPADDVRLEGELIIPTDAGGVVVFAHGSGSSRHSPRNRHVAERITDRGLGTLLFDLLTAEEESVDIYTRHLRFDISMLATRLASATRWLKQEKIAEELGVGYFGASTGGGAALVAAAELGDMVSAVVSRGGRPDLAADALPKVTAPTLLIVGERDEDVLELNKQAFARLRTTKQLQVVSGASHLFEEPGALDRVADLAASWFVEYLRPAVRSASTRGQGG
jgi:putative phosphoribosyl transferase